MSSHLPDNIDHWPQGYYQLLDVEQNVSRTDLKRAYNKLIRLYKPDREPDKFSRIRQAYESIESQLRWREQYQNFTEQQSEPSSNSIQISITPSPTELETSSPDQADAESLASNRPTYDSTYELPPRIVLVAEQLPPSADTWLQSLGDAELRAAYYQELAHRAKHAQDFAQLYWLLLLYPELEPESKPFKPYNWLILGLNKSYHHYLYTMLLDEMFNHAISSDHPLLLKLMETIAPQQLKQLVHTRWHSARGDQLINFIQQDVQLLKTRMEIFHRQEWLAFLTTTCTYLSLASVNTFSQARQLPDIKRNLMDEIELLGELHLQLGYLLDEMEFMDRLQSDLAIFPKKWNPLGEIVLKTIFEHRLLNYIPKDMLWHELRQHVLTKSTETYSFLAELQGHAPLVVKELYSILPEIHLCYQQITDLPVLEYQQWIITLYDSVVNNMNIDVKSFKKFISLLIEEQINPQSLFELGEQYTDPDVQNRYNKIIALVGGNPAGLIVLSIHYIHA